MDEFRIILRNDNIYQDNTAQGQRYYVDIPICVQVGDCFFPYPDWTDMAYPILCHWIENLVANKGRKNASYILYFMDGPHYMEIHQNGYDLKVIGVSDRKHYEKRFEFDCTYEEFMTVLLKAIKKLKGILKSNPIFKKGYDSIIESCRYYEKKVKKELNIT